MNQVTAAPLAPSISPEVAVFAAEQRVAEYLPAVLAMTQRIFPCRRLTVLLEGDPEIANDWHIVFEVDITGLSAEDLLRTHDQWSEGLFQNCPSTHAAVFRLGWGT